MERPGVSPGVHWGSWPTEPVGQSKGIVVDESNRDLLVAVLALLTDVIPPRPHRGVERVEQGPEESLAELLLSEGILDGNAFTPSSASHRPISRVTTTIFACAWMHGTLRS